MNEADILFQVSQTVANLFEVIDTVNIGQLPRALRGLQGANVHFIGLVRLFPFV